MIYKQLVLVEFYNTVPFIVKFKSKKEITFENIIKYYEDIEDFNEEKDSLTLLDDIETIML